MTLTSVLNPYNFAHPVTNRDLFVGRDEELGEINYYLDQAKYTQQPMSIAILGDRASGKTSLLNMAALEAQHRGFCTVRINLDEDDGHEQLKFFHKVFDRLLHSACKCGAFGGLDGTTYQTYVDIVASYEVPENKTFQPFLFPIQFARAMAAGRFNASLIDGNYEHDLRLISEQVDGTIVLIMDEVNVLINSRIHLQKLRNIFMNMPHYMLIMAGTSDLFPAIDDVFSPIARQFKKIRIEGFSDTSETKNCITKPLLQINIKPEDIIDFETQRDLDEFHKLSNGSPYEIQLICHFMYKRVQEDKASKMRLDSSVFEDVVRELESSRAMARRAMAARIKGLTHRQLDALNILCPCKPLTLQLAWFFECALYETTNWEREDLDAVLNELISREIVNLDDEHIVFAGDEFDRIYCKYFARERGVPLILSNFKAEHWWKIRLDAYFITKSDLMPFHSFIRLPDNIDAIEIITSIAKGNANHETFERSEIFAKSWYELLLAYQGFDSISILSVKVVFGEFSSWDWYYSLETLSDISEIVTLIGRIESLGGKATYDTIQVRIPSIEQLAGNLKELEDANKRAQYYELHSQDLIESHQEGNSIYDLLTRAQVLEQLSGMIYANNIGYIYLLAGELSDAEERLREAVEVADTDFSLCLAQYNLAILESLRTNFDEAVKHTTACIELVNKDTLDDDKCSTLFVLSRQGDSIILEEDKNSPRLIPAIERLSEFLHGCVT